MRRILFFLFSAIVLIMLMGCDPMMEAAAIDRANALTSDAAIARRNLETAEQNFQVFRRVVFYNGITGEYILQVEGYLAIIVDGDGDLVVTIKTSDSQYLKHYLGLSDNVTWFSEALIPNSVSDSSYKVIFKPSVLLPTIEIR